MTENVNVFVSSFCLSVLLLFRHFPRVRKNSFTIFDVSEELDFCRDILVKVCDVDTCGVEASASTVEGILRSNVRHTCEQLFVKRKICMG